MQGCIIMSYFINEQQQQLLYVTYDLPFNISQWIPTRFFYPLMEATRNSILLLQIFKWEAMYANEEKSIDYQYYILVAYSGFKDRIFKNKHLWHTVDQTLMKRIVTKDSTVSLGELKIIADSFARA
jgi:hypothetical protein